MRSLSSRLRAKSKIKWRRWSGTTVCTQDSRNTSPFSSDSTWFCNKRLSQKHQKLASAVQRELLPAKKQWKRDNCNYGNHAISHFYHKSPHNSSYSSHQQADFSTFLTQERMKNYPTATRMQFDNTNSIHTSYGSQHWVINNIDKRKERGCKCHQQWMINI